MLRRFALSVLFFAPVLGHAQDSNPTIPLVPQITVVGHGETKVSPDRATIQISVQTRASTAAAAASANASRQRSVLDALKRLGLTDEQLSTTGYNVSPEQRYEPNRAPVIIGYVVNNTIVADVRDLSRVGAAIDAALAAGANVISSLQFYASTTQQARQLAITAAIQSARAEAEVAAKAAGGVLGGLLDLTIGNYYTPPPRPMMMARATSAEASPETPINPGQEIISVDVTTRWRFSMR
jgi:uncharacterized protein YggE